MKTVDYALALSGTRYFECVGVMAQQLLIYAGNTAYSCHSSEPFGLS